MKNKKNNKVLNLKKREISLENEKRRQRNRNVKMNSFATSRMHSRAGNISYSNKIFEKKVELNKEFVKKQYDPKTEFKTKLRKIQSVRINKGRKWHSSRHKSEVELKGLKKLSKKKFSTSIGNKMFKPKLKEFMKAGKFMSKSQSNFLNKLDFGRKEQKQPEITLNLPSEMTMQSPIKPKPRVFQNKLDYGVTVLLNDVDVTKKKLLILLSEKFKYENKLTSELNDNIVALSRELRNSLRLLKPLDSKSILSQISVFLKNVQNFFKKVSEEKEKNFVQKNRRKSTLNLEPPSKDILGTKQSLNTRRSRSDIDMTEDAVEYSKMRNMNNQIQEFIKTREKVETENKKLKHKLFKAESLIRDLKSQFTSNDIENDHNIHRMKLILTTIQEKLKDSQNEITSLTKKVNWYKKEENSVGFRLKHHREAEMRYREIALMQLEEMNSIKRREEGLIEVIKELRGRLVIKKMEKSEIMTKETLDIFKKAEEAHENKLHKTLTDDYLFIKNSIVEDFKSYFDKKKTSSSDFLRFSIENFIVNKTKMRQNVDDFNWKIRKIRNDFRKGNEKKGLLERVDLSNLRLYKPKLADLLNFRVSNMSNKEIEGIINQDFNLLSLVRKIRAIFDGKWNEFCYYDDRRMHSNFSDFVYSWLANFRINIKSMKIYEDHNISQKQADIERLRVILQIRSTLFGKHWECVSFRDFLDGKNSPDEIYFYLFCRDALFKRSLMSMPDNYFEMIQYSKWEKVLDFLKKILKKFQRNDFQLIRDRLEKVCIIQGNDKKIDSAYVLRILLEIYRVEKKLKYDYIKNFLEVKSKIENRVVTNDYLSPFENFRAFFNVNYINRTELDVIELYSECYNIGKGNINFDTLFMVMQEQGFLIDDLKLTGLNLKGNLIQNSRMNQICYQRMNDMLQNEYKILEKFKIYSDNLGNETLIKNLNKAYLMIENPKKDTDWRDIIRGYSKILAHRQKMIGMLVVNLGEGDQEILEDFMKKIQKNYNELYLPLTETRIIDTARRMRRGNAALKLQRWVTKKLSAWYKLMKQVISGIKVEQPMIEDEDNIIDKNDGKNF